MKKLIAVSFVMATVLWIVSCQKDKPGELPQNQEQYVPENVQDMSGFEDMDADARYNTSTEKPEYTEPVVVSSARNNITVMLYTSRTDFLEDCPDLPTEDFENSNLPPNSVGTCSPDILGGCYPAGELLSGFNMLALGGGTQDIAILTTGFLGVNSTVAGANVFADDTRLTFSGTNNTGVGFDIVDVFGGSAWTITLTGTSGQLWSGPATGSVAGTFYGFKVTGDVITQIDFTGTAGTAGELIDNLTFGQCCIDVAVDIKPGSYPNSINCNNPNGLIPVAILSTATFDATTIDHTTVVFEGATEWHTDKNTGEPKRHEEDVDGDGLMDLVFHFQLMDTDLDCESTTGSLEGMTYDGQCIEGSDTVNMIGGE